jgi:hypothetical protein
MSGQLWHTIRYTEAYTWDPFADITQTQAGEAGSGSILAIGAGEVGGELHVVALADRAWHTIRFADSWQPFGDVLGATGNPELTGEHGIRSVAAAGVGGELHVIGIAYDDTATSAARLWHTIRHAAAWDPFRDVNATQAGNPSQMSRYGSVASASLDADLHVVVVGYGGRVWHTIRFADSWQPFGDVVAATGSSPGEFRDVGCANVNGDLHVVGITSEGKLWHTIRHTAAYNWDPFRDVTQTQAGNPGNFTSISCAALGDQLHVVGITTAGGIFHTIRFPDSWQPFGDVKGVTGGPPSALYAGSRVACANVGGNLHVACFAHPQTIY